MTNKWTDYCGRWLINLDNQHLLPAYRDHLRDVLTTAQSAWIQHAYRGSYTPRQHRLNALAGQGMTDNQFSDFVYSIHE